MILFLFLATSTTLDEFFGKTRGQPKPEAVPSVPVVREVLKAEILWCFKVVLIFRNC